MKIRRTKWESDQYIKKDGDLYRTNTGAIFPSIELNVYDDSGAWELYKGEQNETEIRNETSNSIFATTIKQQR